MNLTIFKKLMKETEIRRHLPEWKMFLEICDLYLKQNKIKNPVVIEVGSEKDEDRKFYEQLFGAKYLGFEHSHGQTVGILSINGGQYKDVKRNFEEYFSRCTGIIAIHDIECCRYKNRKASQSWRVWDEIKIATACGAKQFENFLFIAIHRKRIVGNQRGIGVIIKQ